MLSFRHLPLAALAIFALGALVIHLHPYGRSPLAVDPASAPAPQATVAIPENPEHAAARVLALPADERLAAAAALIAATDQPALAVQLARRFCAEDPAHIREHGNTLITMLAENGQFDAALRFAELGGPERTEWLARALQLWVGQDPVRAAQATLSHADGEGFTLVANAWAERDPAGLASFVLGPRATGSFDPAPLEAALESWLQQNPETVTAWLERI